MACVGRSGVLSHWTKTQLKSLRLREGGVLKNWLFSVCPRVLHLDEEGEYEKSVYCCDAEVEGPSPGLLLFGEKAPGASFVTTAVAFRLNVLHFLLIPVCSSL